MVTKSAAVLEPECRIFVKLHEELCGVIQGVDVLVVELGLPRVFLRAEQLLLDVPLDYREVWQFIQGYDPRVRCHTNFVLVNHVVKLLVTLDCLVHVCEWQDFAGLRR